MIKSTDCVLVMGRRGCGKSYLAKNIQSIWPKKIIIDTLNEYGDGELAHSFHEYCDILARLDREKQNQFTVVYKFDPESNLSAREFEEILRLAYYFGNLQIVIEEVQLYSSPHMMPHWLKQCLLIGRHQNLSLMFTTQRPGELNKTILSQCTHIFCGQIIEKNDLRYISTLLPESDDLINLPPRQFLYFSDQGVRQVSNDFKA